MVKNCPMPCVGFSSILVITSPNTRPALSAGPFGNIRETTIPLVVSLNDKGNKAKKIKDFKNFKIDSKIINFAKKDVIFLHCLPRGSEVTDDVFLGKQSKVWQQALNRVYVQKSILLYCFGKLR